MSSYLLSFSKPVTLESFEQVLTLAGKELEINVHVAYAKKINSEELRPQWSVNSRQKVKAVILGFNSKDELKQAGAIIFIKGYLSAKDNKATLYLHDKEPEDY